jgi:hypothetical protein
MIVIRLILLANQFLYSLNVGFQRFIYKLALDCFQPIKISTIVIESLGSLNRDILHNTLF